MCQCGCGERPVDEAYELTKHCILGVKIYDGCEGCFQGLAVDLTVYDSKSVEWLRHLKIDKTVKPNEFGGSNPACGIPIPVIDVRALREQARELEEFDPMESRGTLDEWLEEYGLELLQGAARKFAARFAKEKEMLREGKSLRSRDCSRAADDEMLLRSE